MAETPSARRLSRKIAALDAFPKIDTQLVSHSQSGGLVSLLMLVSLAYLLLSEIYRWRQTTIHYDFLVDPSRSQDHALQINIDITVAMPCQYLRADILDLARTSLPVKQALHASPAYFDAKDSISMKDQVRIHDDSHLNVYKLLKEKNKNRHSKSAFSSSGIPNSCRFHGEFPVNKVEGMLHFTAVGHGYNGIHTPHDAINFTHRIDELSFGQHYPGLWNPLDHTHKIAHSHFDNFMYYIGVVPTIYVDQASSIFTSTLLTNQYAVTEHDHQINMESPDAIPGIFIKYGIEPVSVRVTEGRTGIIQFITRICGIVGGAYVTIGAILSSYQSVSDLVRRGMYMRVSTTRL